MRRFDQDPFRILRLSWWQAALLAAVAISAVLAVAIVATSLILIIAPILLIAVLVHRFLARRRMPPERGGQPTVIEAEYEVIPVERRDRRWPDSGREGRNTD